MKKIMLALWLLLHASNYSLTADDESDNQDQTFESGYTLTEDEAKEVADKASRLLAQAAKKTDAFDNSSYEKIADDQPITMSWQDLRKIRKLQKYQTKAKLVVSSIINASSDTIAILNNKGRPKFIMQPGAMLFYPAFIQQLQTKIISHQDRLRGVCDQFNLRIVTILSNGYIDFDNLVHCNLELVINFDEIDFDTDTLEIDHLDIEFLTNSANSGTMFTRTEIAHDQKDAYVTIRIRDKNPTSLSPFDRTSVICNLTENTNSKGNEHN